MAQAKSIELTQWQIDNLSRPLVKMLEKMEAFYNDPVNEKKFQEWLAAKKANSAKDK